MNYAVLKNASYVLVHTPEMILHNGTTQTTEVSTNPNSDYIKNIRDSYRSYEEVVNYAPNQTYIGNMNPDELKNLGDSWIDKKIIGKRDSRFGEILPEKEFLLLLKICDKFGLVLLEESFVINAIEDYKKNPIFKEEDLKELKGVSSDEIKSLINEHNEGLYYENQLVGCVKKAHDIDINLNSHTMFENLVVKTSGVVALRHLIVKNNLNPSIIDYIIECSEEACGDMNQRGGGNFAKSIGEMCGTTNATGCDIRGFCAAPTHSLINAASLVKSGTYENVVVVAGGASAKLGMNGKDHVKKGLPILEDVLGAFAILVSKNDGVSPIIRTDLVGKHSVGTGSSPQAVMTSLIVEPLLKEDLKITDVDRYSVEMQNPDITKPAGAGDVPEGNYKMIGAIGVKRGEIERTALANFIDRHGMKGWAPTQGHIPSGVPYCGFAIDDLTTGNLNRVMIIGKGSLFLGRMTNQFDGVSIILERNKGIQEEKISVANNIKKSRYKIGVTTLGSELGKDFIVESAQEISKKLDAEIVLIGEKLNTTLKSYEATTEEKAHKVLEDLLSKKELDAVVTMHYNFPVGVATIGRVVTPTGKEVYIASTTGTTSTNRVESMIKNSIYGSVVAKSCGVENPTIGILNIEGAKEVEKQLKKLQKLGYNIAFGESKRADGGVALRGNDLILGSTDVVVTDSLTGNILMKMFSSFNSGGKEEVTGYGYGPGIGFSYRNKIFIVSRASGKNVIKGAIEYAYESLKGEIDTILKEEENTLKKIGFDNFLNELSRDKKNVVSEIKIEKEIVTAQIPGIDIMELENAVEFLKSRGVYSEAGMGCTGPIVMVNESKEKIAVELLKEEEYLF